jgi:hypothetical protein
VARGPVEYLVLGFSGNAFTGNVAPALDELVRAGAIRILDLVFVTKDGDGDSRVVEYDDVEEFKPFGDLDGEVGGLIGLDDIEYIVEATDANSSLAVLVLEDVWAARLMDALRDADGVVVEGGRIPCDLVDLALHELRAAG